MTQGPGSKNRPKRKYTKFINKMIGHNITCVNGNGLHQSLGFVHDNFIVCLFETMRRNAEKTIKSLCRVFSDDNVTINAVLDFLFDELTIRARQ